MDLGLTSRPVLRSENRCCELTTNFAQVRTKEAGLQVIDQILAKRMLCWHDVEDINEIYHSIDMSERQIGVHSQINTKAVVEKIVNKAHKILQKNNRNYEDIISLFYLKNFIERGWGINNSFGRIQAQLTLIEKQKVAAHLPSCTTLDQFSSDFRNLIDLDSMANSKIIESRDNKIDEIKRRKFKEEAIKSELEKLRINHLIDALASTHFILMNYWKEVVHTPTIT